MRNDSRRRTPQAPLPQWHTAASGFAAKPSVPALRRRLAVLALAGLLAWPTFVEAQRPRIRPSPRNLARQFENDRRQEMIRQIERQMREAQQILAEIQTQQFASESELAALGDRLSSARGALDQSASEQSAISRKIREIESRILESQKPGSSLDKAEQRLADAEESLRKAQVAALENAPANIRGQGPLDAAIFTPGQQAYLKSQEEPQQAQTDRDAAVQERNRVRQQLFESNKEWKQAQQERQAAARAADEAAKERRQASRQSSRGRSQSQSMAAFAQQAQNILAVGAVQLKQLGVSDQRIQDLLQGKSEP